MTPIIDADHLTKWYGPRRAVDGVSLSVRSGEVMGLLGPNGSGKTTILRMLTGYLRPTSGTARIAGVDVVDDPLAARARIGYVPENAPLYDAMRVREFLGFMARVKGLPRARVPAAVDRAVERLSLGAVARLEIAKLSRGFRQRVAIAQALLGEPEVMILDEPANGLDPKQIIEMRGLIRSLASSLAVLVTSHILSEIERVADRVAILLGGRLLAVHALRGAEVPRRLRLSVRGPLAEIESQVRRVPGVVAVVADGNASPEDRPSTVFVEVEDPSVAEAVAAAVVGGGFRLAELASDPIDLESIFLELTGDAGQRSDRQAAASSP